MRRRGAPHPDEPLVTVETVGARRLVAAADGAARALGLSPALTVAHAQAMVPNLHLAPAAPQDDAAALSRLARWCLRYAPLVAPDPPDGILLDVAGAAHLFGGEAALVADLEARLGGAGIAAKAALADTPAAAWALARYGPGGVAPPAAVAGALENLPVEALRLDPDTAERLRRLGLDRIGPLSALPRAPLTLRFGPELGRRLDQAYGRAAEPVAWMAPPGELRRRLAFAEPIGAEDLPRVSERLCRALCAELERQGLGARRLDLVFGRVDRVAQAIRIGTGRPSRDPRHLARLFALRLDGVDPGFGIEDATLVAARTEPLDAPQLSTVPEPEAAVAELVDRLAVRLGPQNLFRIAPRESDLPERCVRRLPPLAPPAGATWPALPRPTRLVEPPEPVEATALLPDHPPALFVWRRVRRRVVRADGPERIFGEWWRSDAETPLVRDYYAVEDETGARYWLFRDAPVSEGGRWWLHGIFA